MSQTTTKTKMRPEIFSTITQKALKFADSVRDKSQESYQKLEAKQGSFYNLAKKYDEANTIKSSSAKAVWKASLAGIVVGGIAGGVLGGVLSFSLFGSDFGLTAGWGAWRGAVVGAVVGGAVGFFNHKKAIETNFVNNLIKNKEQMSGSTTYQINQLEKAINNRGSILQEAMRFKFPAAWKSFRNLEYKKQLQRLADDARCHSDINAYIQRLHTIQKASAENAAKQEDKPFEYHPELQEEVVVAVKPFFTTSPKVSVV